VFWRFTVRPAHIAVLALFAHLLVAAHMVSHLPQSPLGDTSQHCAICAIGKRSAGIPTAVIASGEFAAIWVAAVASPTAGPMRDVEGATLPRGPPSSALATLG
jgi:hypothetical protein